MPAAPPLSDREMGQPLARPKPVDTAFTLWIANAALSLIAYVVTLTLGGDALREAARDSARASGGGGLSEADIDTAVTAGLVFSGVIAVAFFALYLLFAFKMRAGRNWARITLTVLGALGLISGLFSLLGGGLDAVSLVLNIIQIALIGTAIFMMWQKEATHYFEAAKRTG
ncbi:hypothetical protein UO65_1115 [Actinokineospora spheciospongiae]|uniref:Uncharacterized protein n=2 Tax=Actinokineospora spheciospongiae TaxID=909613 RepID=W7ISU4_9PSEU|nr:hypothetical protein UO65_1115 [Actinokineospora spheciospongiae]PWW64186.1 hypothetical protein DFQ13_103155 [Actinokineospora spheciospongiae]